MMIPLMLWMDVYYYMRWRLKLEGETENTGVCTKCTKERKGVTAEVLYSWPLPALIHWEVKVGGTGMKERRWVLLKIPRCDIDGVGEGK